MFSSSELCILIGVLTSNFPSSTVIFPVNIISSPYETPPKPCVSSDSTIISAAFPTSKESSSYE